MDLRFKPAAPLCSTDSFQDRTDEQKKGPNIYVLVLKSQYDYIPSHSSSSTSLVTPTNPTACGVKGLKISYFVVPQLLRSILTKGCTSPEEQTVSLKSDKTDSSLHDSTGEPVSESEQL